MLSQLSPDFPVQFWIFTVAMVLLALVFVLVPLFRKRALGAVRERKQVNVAVYRDQLREMEAEHASGKLDDAQFEASKREIESRLAEDALTEEEQPIVVKEGKKLGIALAASIPLLAFGIYFAIGNPKAITEAVPDIVATDQHSDINAMLETARQKAEANPDDGRQWFVLGRSYAAVGRWQEAGDVLAKAVKLLPGDATVLATYAESQGVLNNRILKGRPAELIQEALKLDENNQKALELAGFSEFQEGNYPKAISHWEKLLSQLELGTPYAVSIGVVLSEAKARAGGATGQAPQQPTTAQASGSTIKGTVDISPTLKSKLTPGATVFVAAKGPQGGMPVAAIRAKVEDLPLQFELNDSMAMMPTNKLTSYQEVMLTARISTSGQAMPQSGDLEGVLAPVKVGANDVKLVIDTVRP